ncbi:MAG: hypothetical protein ACR2NM_17560, partial [Bythopirellula sp.]
MKPKSIKREQLTFLRLGSYARQSVEAAQKPPSGDGSYEHAFSKYILGGLRRPAFIPLAFVFSCASAVLAAVLVLGLVVTAVGQDQSSATPTETAQLGGELLETAPLELEGDIAAQLVSAADRFLL